MVQKLDSHLSQEKKGSSEMSFLSFCTFIAFLLIYFTIKEIFQ